MRMKCPICEDVRMREVMKDGVTIDVCPDCKGVWLDRGELDKLMQGVNAMRQELDEYEGGQASFDQPAPNTAPLPPDRQQPAAPQAQPYPPQAQPAPGYGQQYQQHPGGYGAPQQPVYGNPQHGQGHGHYGSMPPQPQGGYGYGNSHKYDKYGSKYGYDKYGRPYKKHKTVLDVFGDLFD